MNKLLTNIVMVGVLSYGAAAFAQHPGPERMGGEFLLKDRMIEKLELSGEQVSQIRVLTENFQSVYPHDESTREAHHAAMQALMQADTFDTAAAAALVDAQDERKIAAMKLRFDINQVLTDEQKATLQSMRGKMKKHRKHERGER